VRGLHHNIDNDRQVKLQCYLDAELRNEWKLAAESRHCPERP
jgi:hypothetical protein